MDKNIFSNLIKKANPKYFIGFRTLKTGIAVLICIIIGMIFNRESVFYSSIAAVICMQPTYKKTFVVGLNRFIGTIIGGVVGYFILELIFSLRKQYNLTHVIIIPVFIIVLIYICNLIGKKESASICCIVFLSIVTNYNRDIPDTLLYVINRVIDTSVGIAVAMLVNRFIFPRSEQDKMPEQSEVINQSTEQINSKPN